MLLADKVFYEIDEITNMFREPVSFLKHQFTLILGSNNAYVRSTKRVANTTIEPHSITPYWSIG